MARGALQIFMLQICFVARIRRSIEKSPKMKLQEIRFRMHFCERHRKMIHVALEFRKNQSDFALGRRVQVGEEIEIFQTRVICRPR